METKRFSPWADLGVLAAILLGATIVVAVCSAVVMMIFPGLGRDVWMLGVYTAQFVLAIVGGWIWLRPRDGVRLRFGGNWTGWPVVAGVVVVAAAGVVIEPVINLFPSKWLELLDQAIGRGGWAILMTVVAAPVLEEIFFRGLVLETLSRKWSPRVAVVASAALFGVMHAPILPQMVNAFAIAIVMGYIYLWSRSLVPVIVIHAINNGLAYMTLELTGSQATDTREMIGNDTIYWLVFAASALVVVAAIVVLDRITNTKSDKRALE